MSREIEGRDRRVCPACGFIYWENPTPVAAAFVPRESGEILLVRRKLAPARGKWCLPMGFAEVGESIQEAALRELREETGLTGRIRRLLSADSSVSPHKGDLLIVTFVVDVAAGDPVPGDDAVEVAWTPLDALPPLPFSSNRSAVRAWRERIANGGPGGPPSC